MNSNKACSFVTILNEHLKESIDFISYPSEKLFNYILEKKKAFQNNGRKGSSSPFIKREIQTNLATNRAITLVSCLGKLYTSIVNEGLKKWELQNDVITDAQFGFKADYSTIDAIFILEPFISKAIREKKKNVLCVC